MRRVSPQFSVEMASRSVSPENGGDPTQEGCFFEVDNAEAAFAELKEHGLEKEEADFSIDQDGDTSYKVFFVVAPDGLCYCFGERQRNIAVFDDCAWDPSSKSSLPRSMRWSSR